MNYVFIESRRVALSHARECNKSLVSIVINKRQGLSVNRSDWPKFDVFLTSVFCLPDKDSQMSDFLCASFHTVLRYLRVYQAFKYSS